MVLEIEKQAAVDFRYAQKTCTETWRSGNTENENQF